MTSTFSRAGRRQTHRSHRSHRRPLRVVVAVALLVCSSLAQATHFRYSSYTWTRLNLLSSDGQALNAAGNAVGGAVLLGQLVPQFAFITANQTMNVVQSPPAFSTVATGINNSGGWVGYDVNSGTGNVRGLYNHGAGVVLLNALGGDTTRFAGINAAGVAVGHATTPAGDTRGFIYDGLQVQALPTLGGATSWASAINQSGQVVGSATNALGRIEAFLFEGNTLRGLGSLGGSSSQALGINSHGDVVGAANRITFGPNVAFVWRNGQMSALGTLGGNSSQANAINDSGLAVGWGFDSGAQRSAFVAGVQGMHDLNAYLAAALPASARLTDAVGINRHGQILANSDAGRAVLLTPEGRLTWTVLNGGSFTDGRRWDSGVGQGPSRFLDMVLVSPASQSVALSDSADVRSLVIGAAGGDNRGQLRLRLQAGAVLGALEGVVIERSGVISGDGKVQGSTLLRGTIELDSACCLAFEDGYFLAQHDVSVAAQGLVTGSGQMNARLHLQAGGELRVGTGQHLRLSGTSNLSEGAAEVRGGEWEVWGAWANRGSGTVRLDNATVRFYGGLVNASQVQIGFGGASVFGRVDNLRHATVVASGGNQTTFWDGVSNQGEMRASAGAQVIYFGAVDGAGSFTTQGAGAYHRFEAGYSPGNSAADVWLGETQLASLLTLELAGTAPGAHHDRISFTGGLQLDPGASLQVLLLDGFAPQLGDSFDLFVFAAAPVGSFDSLRLPALADGLRWDTSALYTAGDLRVAVVPEPAAWWLMAGGLAMLLWRRRQQRAAD